MGSGEFAVKSFEQIVNSKSHKIAAVFTQNPKEGGRGMNLLRTPIHKKALEHNIPVYTPSDIRTKYILELISGIHAEIIVVVSYGYILPKTILSLKKYGCINIHPSKLPRYRGPTPIENAILNGDKETAVSIIQMDENMDSGDIIAQHVIDIGPKVNSIELHKICSDISGTLLINTLDNIDILPRLKQSDQLASYTKKNSQHNKIIDWSGTAYKINCQIRAFFPYISIPFMYNKQEIRIKILDSDYKIIKHSYNPGRLILDKTMSDKLSVVCSDGIIELNYIQPEGKKVMSSSDYLNGIQDKTMFFKEINDIECKI
ncbi:methionyl-tRNA formyltransferase [Rickettsia endosymbiont of Cardiosporidium cionae]|nr:methionyl-tRNA formyltransferase [Rickettsia endosymbiont of Cardiosporidium cionae]